MRHKKKLKKASNRNWNLIQLWRLLNKELLNEWRLIHLLWKPGLKNSKNLSSHCFSLLLRLRKMLTRSTKHSSSTTRPSYLLRLNNRWSRWTHKQTLLWWNWTIKFHCLWTRWSNLLQNVTIKSFRCSNYFKRANHYF